MPRSIQQFGIAYNADQDRLLLSVVMDDKSEIQLWLTRSFTRALFDKMVASMHHRPELERIQQPRIKEAAVNMSHQEAVSSTRFVKRQAGGGGERNLMSETGPLIVKTGSLANLENGGAILTLTAIIGKTIRLMLNKQLLHSFCQLLIKKSNEAAWDLNLSVGDPTAMPDADTNVH